MRDIVSLTIDCSYILLFVISRKTGIGKSSTLEYFQIIIVLLVLGFYISILKYSRLKKKRFKLVYGILVNCL